MFFYVYKRKLKVLAFSNIFYSQCTLTINYCSNRTYNFISIWAMYSIGYIVNNVKFIAIMRLSITKHNHINGCLKIKIYKWRNTVGKKNLGI